jgi:hypothetical protein
MRAASERRREEGRASHELSTTPSHSRSLLVAAGQGGRSTLSLSLSLSALGYSSTQADSLSQRQTDRLSLPSSTILRYKLQ